MLDHVGNMSNTRVKFGTNIFVIKNAADEMLQGDSYTEIFVCVCVRM